MDIFSVSLLESFYIIYMMNFFRTKYNFAHPLTYFKNDYLYHPVDKADKPRRMICRFGRDVSWFLALYFYLRGILEKYNKVNMRNYTKIVLGMVLLGSLVNLNLFIYFPNIRRNTSWRLRLPINPRQTTSESAASATTDAPEHWFGYRRWFVIVFDGTFGQKVITNSGFVETVLSDRRPRETG